jgi:superfamily I DNA/RNA helicase
LLAQGIFCFSGVKILNLNENQQKAVDADGHLLVSACPGAGKTAVLSQRAVRLLKSNPKGILVAVTFTKDSANELKERIVKLAGESAKNRVAAGTFHGLALKQIEKSQGKRPRLINEGERNSLIASVYARHGKNISLDDAIKAIDFYKTIPEEIPFEDTEQYRIYNDYQMRLEKMGAMDFSDLILNAVTYMREGSIQKYPAAWMLVDEAQDIDEVQYAWVKEHSKNGTSVTMVGDDDQSLYSFRHALGFDGMMRFMQEHGASLVTLPVNYRCVPEVLNPAAKLIKVNQKRVDKDIVSARKESGEVEIESFADYMEEADIVTKTIMTDGSEFSEWAVLARNNRMLDLVEISLKSAGVPYSRKSDKFMDRKEPSALLSLLSSLADDNHVGIYQTMSWMGIPNQLMESFSHEYHNSLDSLIASLGRDATNKKQLQEFSGLMSIWKILLEEKKENNVIQAASMFFKKYSDDKKHKNFDIAAEILCRYKGSLKQKIAQATQDNKEDGVGVKLMTMHGSKGLEWDNVWIVGADSEKVPSADSPLEEERRIFYVGMTRARYKLWISYCGKPTFFLKESGLINA